MATLISTELYDSTKKIMMKRSLNVDISVLMQGFRVYNSQLVNVNKNLEVNVNDWEKEFGTKDSSVTTDTNNNNNNYVQKFHNLDVEENMCPSLISGKACNHKMITEEKARDSKGTRQNIRNCKSHKLGTYR